jgi:hypothetical protein
VRRQQQVQALSNRTTRRFDTERVELHLVRGWVGLDGQQLATNTGNGLVHDRWA